MSVQEQLQPGEEILYVARPTRVVLVPLLVLAVVLVAAGVAGELATRQLWPLLLGGIPGLAALVVAGARHWALRFDEYVLTDRRVIRQTGIWSKSSMDSYLDKINNVEHGQTFSGRVFGFGDVEIDTASETGATVFPRIKHPLDFKRAIDAAAAAFRTGGRRPPAPAAPSAAAAATPSAAEKIRQLKSLLDEGLITQAEFDAKRKQLLEEI
jgi:uncharacterized membrane protein YdbT with pleckstrin-like domain